MGADLGEKNRNISIGNYALIDYTVLQSVSIIIVRNGISHRPVKHINLPSIVIFRNDFIQS
jgi:hypothetical protein